MSKTRPKLLTERQWFKRIHPTPLIRHLQALGLIRQTEPTRRKRVAFIAAVCRRLFPLLDRPYIATSTTTLIGEMERYAQGSTTAKKLVAACDKWRELKMTGGTYMWDWNYPFPSSDCQRVLAHADNNHEKKLRTQGLPQEMKVRVHCGTQAVNNFAWDFVFTDDHGDDLQREILDLIRGCQAAALAVGGVDAAGELVNQCSIIRDIFGNPFHKPSKFENRWRTDTVRILAKQMYEAREFSGMPILADALQDAGCENPDILNHCRDTNQVHVRGCWVVDLVLDKQ